MSEAARPSADPARLRARGASAEQGPLFAALDLGTNNCRLLIAARQAGGFRVVDTFSRIVRLGEGLSQTGRLSEAAMERALGALRVCGEKIRRQGVSRVRAVATQACRSAANSADFIAAVAAATGVRLEIITPREEARLAVAGCLDLIDPQFRAALVLDVGGGSTELSWIDLTRPASSISPRRLSPGRAPVKAWCSTPLGVITLAERFPEAESTLESGGGDGAHFRRMVDAVKAEMAGFTGAEAFRETFAAGEGHIVGTSGAITSLAGLHLRLRHYDRAQVDGLWMTRDACEAVAARLGRLSLAQRAAEPCIGPGRADLVLAGAAILQAVQELWPCDRLRVADRGLREGLLLSLMSGERPGRSRRRRGGRKGRPE